MMHDPETPVYSLCPLKSQWPKNKRMPPGIAETVCDRCRRPVLASLSLAGHVTPICDQCLPRINGGRK